MFLVNQLDSSEKYVYHYTKVDTALNYILKMGKLRLNSFSKVNDPRESKNWSIITTVSPSSDLNLQEWDALSDVVSDALKRNVKLVCFSKDSPLAVSQQMPESRISRGFAKPSMWHHYANAHNGVCLVFDINKLNTSFQKQVNANNLFSRSVSYSNKGMVPNFHNYPFSVNLIGLESEHQFIDYLSKHLEQWLPNLFFSKLNDWSNEAEYRWVYFDDQQDPILLMFDDALEGIVMGAGVSEDHYEEIQMYCAKYEADIVNLGWRNGYPDLIHPGCPYITHKYLLDKYDSV
jgi:hypothetical protein